MNFFTHIFEGFWLDFKLLFILLFLGIISWQGASRFNGGDGGVQMGGPSFLSGGGVPHGGASVLMGFLKKIGYPLPLTMGNPDPVSLFTIRLEQVHLS